MTYLGSDVYVKQKPMLLMKYFVAVAAGEETGPEFLFLDVAPYLVDSKWSMLEQITGIPLTNLLSMTKDEWNNRALNTTRLAHPHLPQSYCLLAMQMPYSIFN